MVDRQRFQEYVQEALTHLYDYSYLQTHPLAALIAEGLVAEARGRTLYRLLVAAIDQLKPDSTAPRDSTAWRKYHVLFRRYMEGVAPEHVAEEFGITSRQARRHHHESLLAIADMLYAKYELSHSGALGAVAPSIIPGSAGRAGVDSLGPDLSSPGRKADTFRGRGISSERALAHSASRQTTAASGEVEADSSEADYGPLLEAELSRLAAAAPRAPTALREVAAGALTTVSRLAEARGVVLGLVAPDELPSVAVDRTLLRQVLLGLLNYAIEQPGAFDVALAITSRPEGARLEIAIAGLTAEPRPDYRLEMGRRLLEMQAGKLACVVDGQRRLTFAITLPFAHRSTVLVVDDNPDVALLFRHYLDSTYRIVQAHSSTEALTLARELRPDVMTLDVLMPSADGWEILQKLRADEATRDLPVIVCSVVREGSLALSLGAAEFLPKPVSREGLRSALERCLGRRTQAARQGLPADSG